MRAREPSLRGSVARGDVQIAYEVFGDGPATIVMLAPWAIANARIWKAQVPFLARHARVVTLDPRGNGASSRPTDPAAYRTEVLAGDVLAVMDALGVRTGVLVAHSAGSYPALWLAANHPERVERVVFVSTSLPMASEKSAQDASGFDAHHETHEGRKMFNRHFWRAHWPEFVERFVRACVPEAHSTKVIEDCVAWGRETTPDVMIAGVDAGTPTADEVRAMAARITCPVLVVHGDADRIQPVAHARALAEATSGRLVVMEGSGHAPMARDPVRVNLLLRDFAAPASPPLVWRRTAKRKKRALFLSSAIGLGHARRDLAIADELRKLHPGLEIDWLAQHPVTRMLEARGERVHPASRLLAGESEHLESEASEHDLHVFHAWRRMDELLVANFMVFLDVVRDEPYDLWIGDEAWDVDRFLHENPEEKRAPYAWLTDFVGFLPMPDGGEQEATLTADYNAEMLEQIARSPRVRDLALFVGDPEDVVPRTFGPGLPSIRTWTEEHFDFTGWIAGFDPAALADRASLRAELGFGEREKICIVTVGGAGVGRALLERVVASHAEAKRRVPELRMIVVAGPRIDPASLRGAAGTGIELRSFVPELHRHLAAADVAIVQGGLTTTMELAAQRRPFVYVPLEHHFEQAIHVPHRLERHRAGRRMDYGDASPEALAKALVEELARPVDVVPIDGGGAARAARAIAELLE